MYERILRKALQTPWAITPDYLAIVQDILIRRVRGDRLTAEEIRARIGEDRERPAARTTGMIAVIPVYGVISHRSFEAVSGATSAEWIGSLVRRAVADDEVAAILLDFSSQGGTVEGVPELAAEIFAARQAKPVWAISNALAASAAYWLATQAEELVVTPSGYVGSVGVYAIFEDWTAWLDKEGITINAISAGDHKLEGAPWEKLSEESRAFFQAEVDRVYGEFLAAVARGRNVTVGEVKKTYGQGRVFDARTAKKLGMVDRIATFDETIARLSAAGGRRRGQAARSMATGDLPIVPESSATSTVISAALPAEADPLSRDTTPDPIEADEAAADRDALELSLAELEAE